MIKLLFPENNVFKGGTMVEILISAFPFCVTMKTGHVYKQKKQEIPVSV